MKVGEKQACGGLESVRFGETMSETFSKTKWSHKTPATDRKSVTSALDNGAKWSNNHMYRTSTRDMSSKTPVENKDYCIPKYAGFIPGKSGNSELGRSYTKITRRCF